MSQFSDLEKKELHKEGAMLTAQVGVVATEIVEEKASFELRRAEGLLKKAELSYSESATRVSNASQGLLDDVSKLKESTATARKASKSAVSEVKDQLIAVNKVVGDVELKASQLERIATAMITISDISKDTVVMNAIKSLSR